MDWQVVSSVWIGCAFLTLSGCGQKDVGDDVSRAIALSSAGAADQSPLLAMRDPQVAYMTIDRADLVTHLHDEQKEYFLRPIPRRVHTIWFGDSWRMASEKVDRWRAFAKKFDYEHKVWSEADDDQFHQFLSPENYELLHTLLAAKQYHASSDLLRINLLRTFGGIYADVDIGPPMMNGEPIDLADIAPLQNCLFVTESNGRNVGNGAIFLMNGFMASSAGQPIMEHMAREVYRNAMAFATHHKQAKKDKLFFDAAYITGPFALNKSLSGVIQVLPINYTVELGMVE